MEFGMPIKKIMKKNYKIIDSSESLIECAKLLGKDYSILVFDRGEFKGFVTHEELLKGFLNGNEKVKEITREIGLGIIDSEADISYLFELLKKDDIDIVLVKDNLAIAGVVTKREISKIEPVLFDLIEEKVRDYLNEELII